MPAEHDEMEPPRIAVQAFGGDAAEAPQEALDLAVAAGDALVKNAERRGDGNGRRRAGVSEGRRQGATAASAVGDAARALRPAVLQSERSGDGGPACEAESIRRFAGVSLEKVPDETTILNFRHLLERRGLAHQLFQDIRDHLAERGVLLRKRAFAASGPPKTDRRSREGRFPQP